MDWHERDQYRPALRPVGRRLCAVMVCTDASEADHVGRLLSELNSECLVTYRRVQDLVLNAPAGPVALVILATDDAPQTVQRTLAWLRRRWPHCPLTVVADEGCGEHELAARRGGANFLARPVTREQWLAVLSPAAGAGAGSRAKTSQSD